MTAFVDANIVVYALGRDHPFRATSRAILGAAMASSGSLVTDSEVIQELMHVYLRREGIDHARRAIGAFRTSIRDQIVEATLSDMLTALAMDLPLQLQSRDRVHVAVMQRLGIADIISTDHAFDLVPGIRRLDPLRFDEWRAEVFASP